MKASILFSSIFPARALSLAILITLPTAGLRALAADPLDDTDGTEAWDQVVQPQPKQAPPPDAAADQEEFQKEIADWESIRQTWEQERERYVRERATQKRLAKTARPGNSAYGVMEINDSNLQQTTQPEQDWGDSPGEQWLVPASSVDRAIDDELSETRPASAPAAPPAAPPPAALVPPPLADHGEVPSAFRQPAREEAGGGGLAPTSPTPDAALPPTATDTKKADASDGAKAAEQMLAKQQAEERRRQEAERLQREKEAAEGAAAAAKLLEMQAEQERKEQEALRKKAGVKEDDDGQMVDPDLQREMDDEPGSKD